MSADSLKAYSSKDGNQRFTDSCRERASGGNCCGKFVRKPAMDSWLEGAADTFHAFNAVSPAVACAGSFSEYAFRQAEKLMIFPEKQEHLGISG